MILITITALIILKHLIVFGEYDLIKWIKQIKKKYNYDAKFSKNKRYFKNDQKRK